MKGPIICEFKSAAPRRSALVATRRKSQVQASPSPHSGELPNGVADGQFTK
jgi:hypothetical protein